MTGRSRGRSTAAKKTREALKKKKEEVPENNQEFEIEDVLDHIVTDSGQLMFKIRWSGYDEKSDSWEPRENLANASEALNKYLVKANFNPAKSPGKRNRRSSSCNNCEGTPTKKQRQDEKNRGEDDVPEEEEEEEGQADLKDLDALPIDVVSPNDDKNNVAAFSIHLDSVPPVISPVSSPNPHAESKDADPEQRPPSLPDSDAGETATPSPAVVDAVNEELETATEAENGIAKSLRSAIITSRITDAILEAFGTPNSPEFAANPLENNSPPDMAQVLSSSSSHDEPVCIIPDPTNEDTNDENHIIGLTKLDGEIKVVMGKGVDEAVLSVRDAYERNSWGLIEYLIQRISFNS